MFDFDFDLDLGSRRRQTEWVSVASEEPDKPSKLNKRQRHRQREKKKSAATGQQESNTATITPAQAKYRKEYRDPSVVCLSTEIENGNVEYKYCLSGCVSNPNRRHQLVTQMKYRLSEGGGECFYYIGVEDDGYPRGLDSKELAATMSIISSMASSLSATARLVEYVRGGFGRRAALMHIKANAEEGMRATDLRVAVAGSMDCGKSTLVAVLTHGCDGRPLLDNGRGSARMAVFRHKHEIETGRTSSISQQVLGYDDEARVLNYVGVSVPTPADIAAAAARVLSFIDMGGHEKYLKTTLYGMTCTLPDYVLLCVDASSGVCRITREHLAVAVALEIPTALVVTKADAVDSHQLQLVLEQLQQLMAPVLSNKHIQPWPWQLQDAVQGVPGSSAPGIPAAEALAGQMHGVPVVYTESQAADLAAALSQLHSCTAAAASFQQFTYPVFTVSSVTGGGLPLLHAFLSRLQPASTHRNSKQSGTAQSHAQQAQVGLMSDCQPEQVSTFGVQQQHQLAGMPDGQLHQQLLDGDSSLWVPDIATLGQAEHELGVVDNEKQGSAPGTSDHHTGHFQVVHSYDVEGVGWVVSGIAVTGNIEVGQMLLWGPTDDGGFSPVCVSCIQRSHVPVRQVQPGQTATLALQPAGPGTIRRTSREALLSAAAAAQAAAEAAAAREAAAAVEAAPNVVFGKPYAPPVKHKAVASAYAEAAAVAVPTEAVSATIAARDCSSSLTLDILAADLAAELAGNDDDGDSASVASSSDSGFGDFGAFDDDSISISSTSNAASYASLAGHGISQLATATGDGSCGNVELPCLIRFGLQAFSPGQEQNARVPSSSTLTASSCSSLECSSWVELDTHMKANGSSTMLHGCDISTASTSSARASSPVPKMSNVTAAGALACGASSEPSAPQHVQTLTTEQARHAKSASSKVAQGAMPSPLGCSPPNWRSKGAVLLDAAASPKTYWEFEALLVLLGGHWPARGLLSGCWPPEQQHVADVNGAWSEQVRQEQAFAAPAATVTVAGQLSGIPEVHTLLKGAADPATAHAESLADGGSKTGSVAAGTATGAVVEASSIAPAVDAACSATDGRVAVHKRPVKQRSKRFDYGYVIHCNSIRQIARVVHMKELRSEQQQQHEQHVQEGLKAAGSRGSIASDDSSSGSVTDGCIIGSGCSSTKMQRYGLSASIQAAAALLQGQCGHGSGADSAGASGSSNSARRAIARAGQRDELSGQGRRCNEDVGTVVAVRFRFTHRPEWMQTGARMIVRDRSDGHVAAAGFVTQLLDAHVQAPCEPCKLAAQQ